MKRSSRSDRVPRIVATILLGICLGSTAYGLEAIQKAGISLQTNIPASPFHPNNGDPYKLIDGILYSGGQSLWVRGSAGFLWFDLGAISYLTLMNVIYSSTAADDLEMLVSVDNITFTSLGTVHFDPWNGVPSVDKPIGGFARYVKFVWGPVPSGYSGVLYEEITFFGEDGLVPVQHVSFGTVKALFASGLDAGD